MKKILTTKTTLQYISDIHLEKRMGFPKIPVMSPNIALLGKNI